MKKLLTTLQVILTILAGISLIPVIILFACDKATVAFILIAVALGLVALVAICKLVRGKLDEKDNPPAPRGDFFNPLPKNDDDATGE